MSNDGTFLMCGVCCEMFLCAHFNFISTYVCLYIPIFECKILPTLIVGPCHSWNTWALEWFFRLCFKMWSFRTIYICVYVHIHTYINVYDIWMYVCIFINTPQYLTYIFAMPIHLYITGISPIALRNATAKVICGNKIFYNVDLRVSAIYSSNNNSTTKLKTTTIAMRTQYRWQ